MRRRESECHSAILEFIYDYKQPPSRHDRVSCDCPLYHNLKQPLNPPNTACLGFLDLISLRPSREAWSEHIKSLHAPMLEAVEDLARRLAQQHTQRATSSMCPFGCFQESKIVPEHAMDDGRASLADRMMASIRAETYCFQQGQPPSGNQHGDLATHLCSRHLLELQFIVAFAHELAAVACSPNLLVAGGLSLVSPSSGSPSGISRAGICCPFYLLAQHQHQELLEINGDRDDEASDLELISCDGGACNDFRRGSEAHAAAHILGHHGLDLALIAKHTSEQCSRALQFMDPLGSVIGKCFQSECEVSFHSDLSNAVQL